MNSSYLVPLLSPVYGKCQKWDHQLKGYALFKLHAHTLTQKAGAGAVSFPLWLSQLEPT